MNPTEDTLFRCAACGHEVRLSLAHCLRCGEPVCHDRAMTMVATIADIPRAHHQALQPMTRILAAALRVSVERLPLTKE